jgi:hypothetical protein
MKKFNNILFAFGAISLGAFFAPSIANAQCLKVADDSVITINEDKLKQLEAINYGRKEIFDGLFATSLYETGGCWATPAGNFDAQTLSIGILQWNYGQNSLQDLMQRFRALAPDPIEFEKLITPIMPNYSKIVFAENCLKVPFDATCKASLLALQDGKGKLNPVIYNEMEALFNSTQMRQIQTDKYVEFLGEMAPKLGALFPKVTPTHTRWAMDLAIQQGYVKFGDNQSGFLNLNDVETIRKLETSLTPQQKRGRAFAVLDWYKGLCGGIYQGVIVEQCNFNLENWCGAIKNGLSDEQFDLLMLTYVRSRIAQGQSGRWQANAFARRTKIVLDTGWVGNEKRQLQGNLKISPRCNAFLLK